LPLHVSPPPPPWHPLTLFQTHLLLQGYFNYNETTLLLQMHLLLQGYYNNNKATLLLQLHLLLQGLAVHRRRPEDLSAAARLLTLGAQQP